MITQPKIQPGDQVTQDQVMRIYRGLCEKTLPAEEWTHGAHLCAGTAFWHDLGLDGAETAMPSAIREYNISVGTQNTDTAGYHHTITLFYLRVIAQAFAAPMGDDVGALATSLLNCPIADRAYPLRFYSKARLFSVKARRDWLAPDLKPLSP